jgi:hypothetical protein
MDLKNYGKRPLSSGNGQEWNYSGQTGKKGEFSKAGLVSSWVAYWLCSDCVLSWRDFSYYTSLHISHFTS